MDKASAHMGGGNGLPYKMANSSEGKHFVSKPPVVKKGRHGTHAQIELGLGTCGQLGECGTLDFYNEAFQQYENWVRPVLPEKPSYYLARQVHGTFQVDPVAVNNVRQTGPGPLLWGSDFPHAEGTYPHSRETVRRLFAGVELEAVTEMVAGNAMRLFRFAPEVLTTPV